MLVCPKCGCETNGGKFCEKCGTPLSTPKNANVCPNCGAPVTGGKFCEKCGTPLSAASGINSSVGGFFDKIGAKVNKATSDILAIKSDYSNGIVLYKVEKIPNIQEKTIKVSADEYAFFSSGAGFTKYDATFTTTLSNFLLFFIRKDSEISNVFHFSIDSKIKRIEEDTIKVAINYSYTLSVDPDKFFDAVIELSQNTWSALNVDTMIFKSINVAIPNLIKEKIVLDGELDLSNYKNQIVSYDDDVQEVINKEIEKYGLKIKTLKNDSVVINTEEMNKVLIKNLYK